MCRYRRICTFLLVLATLLSGQEQPLSAPSPTARLHVDVVEGDGALNSIRLHRAHDVAVRVTGAGGEPLRGVTVTFALPDSGPSATFPDGGILSTVQTDDQGTASARGLRPNSIAGQFEIHVTASSRGTEGTATLVQTNAEATARSGHTKWIVILVAIGGAAAGGAVLAARGKSSTPDTTVSSSGSITAGTPTFGPPH
jgi:hypothetical protein